MNLHHRRWPFIIITACLLAVITLPYILAVQASGSEKIFGGFLLNPLDGNSYLAKMYAGWRGEWQFTLPYTAEKGEGHFLFIFYLFLGHLARLFSLPLVTTFHLARILATLILLFSLYRFISSVLAERNVAWFAFVLALFGSGLGWLALVTGVFTSDFWVAETYPLLSAYTNPHFPLGLALVLWLLTPEQPTRQARYSPPKELELYRAKNLAEIARVFVIVLISTVLAAISPFAVVLVLAVLSTLLLVELCERWLEYRRAGAGANRGLRIGLIAKILPGWVDSFPPFDKTIQRIPWVFLGGAPMLLYEAWIIRTDPLLAGWNAQNLTPSPALWDLLIALSPALFLAIPGAITAIKDGKLGSRILLAWAVISLLLITFPFALQRRFLLGFYVPLATLAALGIQTLSSSRNGGRIRPGRFYTLAALTLLISLPTNLVIFLAAREGIQTHDTHLYMSRGEALAFNWLSKNTPPEALVLAAPDTGLLIPAFTGRRVLYGHPFETVNAGIEKAWVEGYFQAGDFERTALLARGVDFVFAGPRERELNPTLSFPGLIPVYQVGGVSIYTVSPAG